MTCPQPAAGHGQLFAFGWGEMIAETAAA